MHVTTKLGFHGPVITCHHSKGSFEVQLSVWECVVSCCPVTMMEHDICSGEWGGLDPYVATCSNNSNKPFIHPSLHRTEQTQDTNLSLCSWMSFYCISALNNASFLLFCTCPSSHLSQFKSVLLAWLFNIQYHWKIKQIIENNNWNHYKIKVYIIYILHTHFISS